MPIIGLRTTISNTTEKHPQHFRNYHACALGMCMVLVPNFGISTSIFNTTQLRPQKFRNFMCVH